MAAWANFVDCDKAANVVPMQITARGGA